MPRRLDGPKPGIAEVSLFGPGYGEAIAIHVTGGEWITIDSCVDDRSGKNALLDYFDRIGVDPAASVKRVVATHAHDDHMKGISEVVAACPGARFVWSEASTSDEFFALVDAQGNLGPIRPTIYAEYRRVIEILEERATSSPPEYPYQNAVASLEIYSRPAVGDLPNVRVVALSPSDAALIRGKKHLGRLLALQAVSPGRRLRSQENVFSIALWIQIGEIEVILGADLLKGPGPYCGWNAVLANAGFMGKSTVYKVPHHGGANAHHQGVWSNVLHPDVIAILTPERGPSHTTPTRDELRLVASLAKDTYISASTEAPKLSDRVRKSAADLGQLAANVQDQGMVGHIRLRHSLKSSDAWTVHLTSPARAVT